jgi:hypothetical protein
MSPKSKSERKPFSMDEHMKWLEDAHRQRNEEREKYMQALRVVHRPVVVPTQQDKKEMRLLREYGIATYPGTPSPLPSPLPSPSPKTDADRDKRFVELLRREIRENPRGSMKRKRAEETLKRVGERVPPSPRRKTARKTARRKSGGRR